MQLCLLQRFRCRDPNCIRKTYVESLLAMAPKHGLAPFQHLHGNDDFEGTGIGLATFPRIVSRHCERIWTEAIPNQGATFYFTFGGT
jgi:light-regulated signal transduction histidine kinase (bacteriophytochrome)